MEFSGAIGGVLLDFSGEWERDASATVKMGVGELKIRVPRDLGVRIERKSFLIALDAEDFVRVDDAYISPNFDTAGHRLVIRLEAALGSVEIERI